MKKQETITEFAQELFAEAIMKSSECDYEVNELLRRIVANHGTPYHSADIDLTIKKLPCEAQKSFIRMTLMILDWE